MSRAYVATRLLGTTSHSPQNSRLHCLHEPERSFVLGVLSGCSPPAEFPSPDIPVSRFTVAQTIQDTPVTSIRLLSQYPFLNPSHPPSACDAPVPPLDHPSLTPRTHRSSAVIPQVQEGLVSHICPRGIAVRMPIANLNTITSSTSSCFTPVPPFVTPAVGIPPPLCPPATPPTSPPRSLDSSPICPTRIRSSTRRAKTSAAASPYNDAADKQHRQHRQGVAA
jgi:hypothetical protein